MFPAALTMFPLATLPPTSATLLRVDVEVVVATLGIASVLLAAVLVRNALSRWTTRPSLRVRALRGHAF
jgi:hypothetical protein